MKKQLIVRKKQLIAKKKQTATGNLARTKLAQAAKKMYGQNS